MKAEPHLFHNWFKHMLIDTDHISQEQEVNMMNMVRVIQHSETSILVFAINWICGWTHAICLQPVHCQMANC